MRILITSTIILLVASTSFAEKLKLPPQINYLQSSYKAERKKFETSRRISHSVELELGGRAELTFWLSETDDDKTFDPSIHVLWTEVSDSWQYLKSKNDLDLRFLVGKKEKLITCKQSTGYDGEVWDGGTVYESCGFSLDLGDLVDIANSDSVQLQMYITERKIGYIHLQALKKLCSIIPNDARAGKYTFERMKPSPQKKPAINANGAIKIPSGRLFKVEGYKFSEETDKNGNRIYFFPQRVTPYGSHAGNIYWSLEVKGGNVPRAANIQLIFKRSDIATSATYDDMKLRIRADEVELQFEPISYDRKPGLLDTDFLTDFVRGVTGNPPVNRSA